MIVTKIVKTEIVYPEYNGKTVKEMKIQTGQNPLIGEMKRLVIKFTDDTELVIFGVGN